MKSLGQRSEPDLPADVEAPDDACETRDAARGADDDFFCLRFAVWYPSFDCALRTRFDTCPGCRGCEQGRFNLKRHAASIVRNRRVLRSFGT